MRFVLLNELRKFIGLLCFFVVFSSFVLDTSLRLVMSPMQRRRI